MGRHLHKRHVWTRAEVTLLRRIYPSTPTSRVASTLSVSVQQVNHKAFQLGLRKNSTYRRALHAEWARRLRIVGRAYQFPKGHVPSNKGLRRPGWFAGRMRETQFKKGQFPVNRDPDFYVLGALRVSTDGYVEMRTSFDHGGKGWTPLHRILWEDEHGPIPKGHVLRFKDGEKLNVCLENLELITLAENCLRNSIHRLPKPLVQVIQLKGALKRRLRETHDKRSA